MLNDVSVILFPLFVDLTLFNFCVTEFPKFVARRGADVDERRGAEGVSKYRMLFVLVFPLLWWLRLISPDCDRFRVFNRWFGFDSLYPCLVEAATFPNCDTVTNALEFVDEAEVHPLERDRSQDFVLLVPPVVSTKRMELWVKTLKQNKKISLREPGLELMNLKILSHPGL